MAGRPGALRLLTVASYFDTHKGGLEIVAGKLARHLAARGFDVSWLATDVVAPEPDAAVRPVGVRAWNVTERRLGVPFPVPGPAGLARLFREVAAADAVLLHDALYPLSMATALACRLKRKPLVVIQHIGAVPYRNRLLRLLMALANRLVARRVLAAADQVVFISAFVRDFFASVRYRAEPQVIFNGVDAEVFRPADQGRARAALELPADGRIALFVGRFVEKKGLHHLERLARRRPDVLFVFAGWGPLEPQAWGLPNVRVFHGRSGSSLAELYAAADVFILPSQGEGFPLVIQEALACGLPVICGDEVLTADPAAAPHLQGVDVSGAPDDVAARLGLALDGLFERPGSADARRRLVVERYGWPVAADRYAAILDRLTGRAEHVHPGATPARTLESL